ncbi:hydroxymethylbilane synthase [Deltaproteobacteria bacterium OttesenSCG-928-K17]|nr:hydroxymethylbilane synthase [Deltaproteobacteria bacterium OttesenSCG-928-K17]
MSVELLKIGARGSPLSLAQTGLVAAALEKANPGLTTEIIPIKTTGDKMRDVSLAIIGGKGVFVKEIEEALLDGRIDLAVHSAKDMPSELPPGLTIAAVPEREDFRDLLVTRAAGGLAALSKGALVGTSGLRRQAQILAARPDVKIVPIRGNVATRMEKVKDEVEATLLAVSGLKRLGLTPQYAEAMSPEIMLPACGQGILALECRADNEKVLRLAEPIGHRPTMLALAAERGFLNQLGSGCQLPVAALAILSGDAMTIDGLIAAVDGGRIIRGQKKAELDSIAGATNFGKTLAEELLAKGGAEIMKAAGLRD